MKKKRKRLIFILTIILLIPIGVFLTDHIADHRTEQWKIYLFSYKNEKSQKRYLEERGLKLVEYHPSYTVVAPSGEPIDGSEASDLVVNQICGFSYTNFASAKQDMQSTMINQACVPAREEYINQHPFSSYFMGLFGEH